MPRAVTTGHERAARPTGDQGVPDNPPRRIALFQTDGAGVGSVDAKTGPSVRHRRDLPSRHKGALATDGVHETVLAQYLNGVHDRPTSEPELLL